MKKKTRKLTVIALLSFGLLTLPATVYATACNSVGCWAAKVTFMKIASDGKIWFVVDNSNSLTNLVPADGCVVKKAWTGQAEPALYITPSDVARDEKYTLLLTAQATEATIEFGPIKDPATGWCALNYVSIR